MNRSGTFKNQKGQMPAALHNLSPKTMAAVVLMSTMAILWGRVLLSGKPGPESAAAADLLLSQQKAAAETASESDASVRVVGQELPYESGRSDTLACDLFSTQRWTAFSFYEDHVSQAPEPVASDDSDEERKHLAALEAMTQSLVLEAVVQGTDGRGMQAFIGGKILAAGQTLAVQYQGQTYTLTVTEIAPQQAILTWKSYSVCLRITESQEQ